MGFFGSSSSTDLSGAVNDSSSSRTKPGRDPKKRPFRINTISMMKTKKDPDMKEQLFETVCTVRQSAGSRVSFSIGLCVAKGEA